MSKAAQQRVTLGGRAFRVIDFDARNVRNDHYLQKHLRASGLDRVLPAEDESSAAYLVRLQAALLDSGVAVDLIAGYLLPDGVSEAQWTPALAADTAAHIGACTAAADRECVEDLALQAVFGFFRQGLARLARFQSSLATLAPTPSPSPQNPSSTPLH